MKKKSLVLWIIAIIILITSATVFALTLIPKGDTDKVVICGKNYYWDDTFNDYQVEEFSGSDQTYEGIKLSTLVTDAGVSDPEGHDYEIEGSDGYQKTVTWEDIQNGYLVKENKVTIFPELTKSFWVKDVIEIRTV